MTHSASATHYSADYHIAAGADHDIMLDHKSAETARAIHEWLAAQKIP